MECNKSTGKSRKTLTKHGKKAIVPFSTVRRMKKSDKLRKYAVCRSFIVLKNVVWKACSKKFF